jgi:hypothetical protein
MTKYRLKKIGWRTWRSLMMSHKAMMLKNLSRFSE